MGQKQSSANNTVEQVTQQIEQQTPVGEEQKENNQPTNQKSRNKSVINKFFWNAIRSSIYIIIFIFPMIGSMFNTPFYWFPPGTLPGLLLVASLSLFYGWLVSIRLLYRLLSIGPSAFFYRNMNRPRPAILDQYGQHKVVELKNNMKIHYVSRGRTDQQVMLFLHGFPESWFSWRYQLEGFGNDYHTVAMSIRGYGDSDKPSSVTSYGLDQLVDDVYQMILKLTQQSNKKKIILVAHDWGGALAWNTAILYPELIDRLIIINAPHPTAFRDHLKYDWRQFFSSWYMFFFQLPWLPEIMFQSQDYQTISKMFGDYVHSNDEIEAYKYYFREWKDVSAPINYYRASFRGYGRKKLAKKMLASKHTPDKPIEPPTLIIWGRNDFALVHTLAQQSARLCCQGLVRYVQDGSHWVLFEKPDQVNQIIRDFLKGALSPKGQQNQTNDQTADIINKPLESLCKIT